MCTSCEGLCHTNCTYGGAASVALRRLAKGPDRQTEAPIRGICGGMPFKAPFGTTESLALGSCTLDITCCSLVNDR
eukprot:1499389-Pleurochrysis_carterae.AAC.4